jgi:hypothetical protein
MAKKDKNKIIIQNVDSEINTERELAEADIYKNISLKQRLMIEALTKTMGIVSQACLKVEISRETHYQWMQKNADYKAMVDAVNEMSIDFAETQLFNLMSGAKRQVVTNAGRIVEIKDAPNPTSIIFYLKTKAKHRGYIEKIETEISLPESISDMVFAIKRRAVE